MSWPDAAVSAPGLMPQAGALRLRPLDAPHCLPALRPHTSVLNQRYSEQLA